MSPHEAADRLHHSLGGAWTLQALNASNFCDTWQARDGGGARLFVKTAAASAAALLRAEGEGLLSLAATHTIAVPRLAAFEASAAGAMLALDWLDFAAPDPGFGARLGERLAALHAWPQPRFGWERDNYIGATLQRNGWTLADTLADWIGFWRDKRLVPMREALARRGVGIALLKEVDAVGDSLLTLFADGHQPRPSLIHGDLWSGNRAMLANGEPVIYDPAVSVSDAEAELAMMELFGSPPAGFWPAYQAG
ncbi:MAG: fructosamine kinase family protein, partial [Thiomonas sp.]